MDVAESLIKFFSKLQTAFPLVMIGHNHNLVIYFESTKPDGAVEVTRAYFDPGSNLVQMPNGSMDPLAASVKQAPSVDDLKELIKMNPKTGAILTS